MSKVSLNALDIESAEPAVAALLRAAGLPDRYRVEPLGGGANNRVYRLDTDERSVVLKWYFSHPYDRRDRLAAEWAFCRYAWDCEIRQIPQLLAVDAENQLALYEFIEGRKLTPEQIGQQHVDAATDFVRQVNARKSDPEAGNLPAASEACFTLQDHLDCTAERLLQLRRIESNSDVYRAAINFVEQQLAPAYKAAADNLETQAAVGKLSLETELKRDQRCLSPSDFGFHNALLNGDSRLRFIDFEYAGWDDPVKLICDFFCQVAVPVPLQYLDHVAEAVLGSLPDADLHRRRLQWLFPVYQIKWCCILLNEFLPVGSLRRHFGNGQSVDRLCLEQQLEKALAAFARFEEGRLP